MELPGETRVPVVPMILVPSPVISKGPPRPNGGFSACPLISALGTGTRWLAAFLLHHYPGFGVRQVAAMTGRPEGTIKADLYHARMRLKAALADTGDDPAPGR